MDPTTEQLNAALDKVRENLQNPASWERVKKTERGTQVVLQSAVIDRTKMHLPIIS